MIYKIKQGKRKEFTDEIARIISKRTGADEKVANAFIPLFMYDEVVREWSRLSMNGFNPIYNTDFMDRLGKPITLNPRQFAEFIEKIPEPRVEARIPLNKESEESVKRLREINCG